MHTSVWIFNLLLDIFIVYTIFVIYFYVLVKYLLHSFEENGIVGFFKKHIEFYKPIISLFKNSIAVKNDPNNIPNQINKLISESTAEYNHTDYFITDLIVPCSILFFGIITLIYFILNKKAIMEELHIEYILFTIFLNIIFIIGFECLFIFFVYGNTDLINIAKILRI